MNVHPDVLDIFLHYMRLPVDDVVTLDELNSDHNPVLLTVDSSLTSQVLRTMAHHIRWDLYRQHMRPVELPLDPFLSTAALEFGIEAYSNTFKTEKIAESVNRPHEAIKYRVIRLRCQKSITL